MAEGKCVQDGVDSEKRNLLELVLCVIWHCRELNIFSLVYDGWDREENRQMYWHRK